MIFKISFVGNIHIENINIAIDINFSMDILNQNSRYANHDTRKKAYMVGICYMFSL